MAAETSSYFDKKAFEALFRGYFVKLCAFANKFTGDLDTSKEIVHDIFVSLWEKRDTIDPGKSLKSYLFASVHNRCLNYIRDNKKFDRGDYLIEKIDNEYQDIPGEGLDESELKKKIAKALDTLPGKCRQIFEMNRFEQLKYKEIAEKLDISVKTVETQMSKALKVLREQLKDYLTICIVIEFFKIMN